MTPPQLTRPDLAAFIERCADAPPDPGEWLRVMVTHYHDDAMESARIRCVQIAQSSRAWRQLSAEEADALRALAKNLRAT